MQRHKSIYSRGYTPAAVFCTAWDTDFVLLSLYMWYTYHALNLMLYERNRGMIIELKVHPGADPVSITRDKPFRVEELVKEYEGRLPYRIMIARVNGKDEELSFEIERDSKIELLDIRTHSAYLAYQHTISLVYLKAVRDVMGDVTVEIDNSLNKGLYTTIKTAGDISDEQVAAVEDRMGQLVEADTPIIRKEYTRQEALEICRSHSFTVKERLLKNNKEIKRAKFYDIDGYSNFFYGVMAPSAGYVEYFQLKKYEDGVLLRFPYPTEPDKVPDYIDDKNLHAAFSEAKKWQSLLGVEYLPDLNRKISEGKAADMILLCEALHEKKIAEMADMITEGRKRIVLIAGPSSSGKTTTAKRLCIQLRVNGLEPLYMGTDDYFVERADTPLDENGRPNYENLEALDIELFNDNMNDLLAGREVDLPEFDFMTGTKVFGKRITSIGKNQPIVIEGIHALNGKLTEFIDDSEKFRIYISPFTQLNIDTHNRVPTTDARMLRRIVRDYKYRNKSAAGTIEQWTQVRAGEDKNIFPFNGEADVVFNTALAYELAVLKKYARGILEEIDSGQPEYSEAVRLLKLLKFFDVIEDENAIPNNSIIREFIGGSIFVE